MDCVACRPLVSMGFSRQEYCSKLPFPPSGALTDPGIEPMSPALADGFFTTEPFGKPQLDPRHCLLFVNAKKDDLILLV